MAARTEITPVTLNRGIGTNVASMLVAVDAANGMKVKYEEQDQLTIYILNTDSDADIVTFKASTSRHAFMRGQGDLSESVAATTGAKMFAGLEQMRFKQDDGYLYIDFAADFTGLIGAFITL